MTVGASVVVVEVVVVVVAVVAGVVVEVVVVFVVVVVVVVVFEMVVIEVMIVEVVVLVVVVVEMVVVNVVVVVVVEVVVVVAVVVVVVMVYVVVVVAVVGQISSLDNVPAPKPFFASPMVDSVRLQVLLLGKNCSTEFRYDDPLKPPKAKTSCCPSLVIVAIWKIPLGKFISPAYTIVLVERLSTSVLRRYWPELYPPAMTM